MSVLSGKTIVFLGSSVTFGGGNRSFVEALAEKDGVIAVKEAVSGTTLADVEERSYVHRMETRLDRTLRPDWFVCQLSTNDAGRSLEPGAISDSFDRSAFDTKTTFGAIEYIISYARETFGCGVSFYTGTKYNSPRYETLVEGLVKIAAKWQIGLIDLWHDDAMNAVSKEDYARFMRDPVHPTWEGYAEWWLPKFEAHLSSVLAGR